MTLSFKLDLDRVRVNRQAKSRSKVISFERYCPHTQTHIRTSALPGPLKCSVKTSRWINLVTNVELFAYSQAAVALNSKTKGKRSVQRKDVS